MNQLKLEEHKKSASLRGLVRSLARQVVELLAGDLPTETKHKEHFLVCLEEELGVNRPDKTKPKRKSKELTYEQLRNSSLDFGIWQARPFDDVPIDYLDMILGLQEESVKLLTQYLNHPETKRLRRSE